MVITLPFALLLLDYWPIDRIDSARESIGSGMAEPSEVRLQLRKLPFSRLALEKVPLLLLSIASAPLTMWTEKAGGAISVGAVYTFPMRMKNAALAYVLYLSKAVWPSRLAVLYPHPGDSLTLRRALVCTLLLLLTTVGVLAMHKVRYLAVGWFWYLGMMVPVIGLVQLGRQAMADRYAYQPLIGIFVMVVWGAADAALLWNISRKYIVMAAVVTVACFSAATHAQLSYWHDSITLWTHTLAVTQNNFIAHNNFGEVLLAQGRFEDAVTQFRMAVQIEPQDPVAQNNLDVLLRREEKINAAISPYLQALRLDTDPRVRVGALTNLGSAYRTLGDYARARESYRAALQLAPNTSLALVGLGLMARQTGDLSQAIEYFTHAVELEPSDVGFILLAQALAESGRLDQANAAFDQARQLSKDLKQAQQAAHEFLRQ
jgi:protein O-mannosyl-transferase